MDGPQKGWRRRTNPVHTMLDTGTDAVAGVQGFPHGLGGADDVIAMPLQCSTQWDGLGHIFDHGRAWTTAQPRSSPDSAIRSPESRPTWPTTCAAAGCFSTSAALFGGWEGVNRRIRHHRRPPIEHDRSRHRARPHASGRGDIVVVPPGQLTRARRDGWGEYAGGSAPGLSFGTAGWLHRTEIAAIATDTWGFEVRPNEFDAAFQPLHQIVIPHIGLFVGEM